MRGWRVEPNNPLSGYASVSHVPMPIGCSSSAYYAPKIGQRLYILKADFGDFTDVSTVMTFVFILVIVQA